MPNLKKIIKDLSKDNEDMIYKRVENDLQMLNNRDGVYETRKVEVRAHRIRKVSQKRPAD